MKLSLSRDFSYINVIKNKTYSMPITGIPLCFNGAFTKRCIYHGEAVEANNYVEVDDIRPDITIDISIWDIQDEAFFKECVNAIRTIMRIEGYIGVFIVRYMTFTYESYEMYIKIDPMISTISAISTISPITDLTCYE